MSLNVIAETKIRNRFEATIPKNVRKLMKLETGNFLRFIVGKDGVIVQKAVSHAVNNSECKEE